MIVPLVPAVRCPAARAAGGHRLSWLGVSLLSDFDDLGGKSLDTVDSGK